MGRAVTFKGAADHPHCGPMTRKATQTTVNVNNIPVSRQGDPNTPHLIPNATPCGTHFASITTGSLTVFVVVKGLEESLMMWDQLHAHMFQKVVQQYMQEVNYG